MKISTTIQVMGIVATLSGLAQAGPFLTKDGVQTREGEKESKKNERSYVPGEIIIQYEDSNVEELRGQAILKNHAAVAEILANAYGLTLRKSGPYRPVHQSLVRRLVSNDTTEAEDRRTAILKKLKGRLERVEKSLEEMAESKKEDPHRKESLEKKAERIQSDMAEWDKVKEASKDFGLSRQLILFLEDKTVDVPGLCERIRENRGLLRGTGILIKTAEPNRVYRVQ